MYNFEKHEVDVKAETARAGAMERFLNGLMAIQEDDFVRSASEFEAALKLDPEYSYAYLGLGKTFLEMHEYKLAI